jgi:indole-3-glycerol phosphate synthase/phosphoribosylanthranilate isomerase
LIDTIPDILARIVAKKHEELARGVPPTGQWEREAELRLATRRDFRAALAARTPAIIAEVKKASPSIGLLQADFDPARIAAAYERGGASALSVLTDESFFQGSLADLQSARAAVSLPVIRKDFTVSSAHVLEAAAHGADAILLIVAILTERQIRDFREAAARYRMAALVEVHNRRELDIAIAAGSDLIGVNNRDLTTFEVSLETSLRLAEHMPAGAIRVSESGIHSAGDIAKLRAAGFTAFLVGGHLMKSSDPAAALRKLLSGRVAKSAIVLKICGITNQEDADAATAAGATAIGFNFYPRSPRYIAPERAAGISTASGVRRVGVFVNDSRQRVEEVVRIAALDVAQLHGDETPADYPATVAVWKAERMSRQFRFSDFKNLPAEALLLDGPAAELYGGAGKTFDWSLLDSTTPAAAGRRIILAGGLDAGNVALAVAVAHPWGVDACSRIESAPGQKDHKKMNQFLQAAKAALKV